jgi:hypothetical protein
VRSPGRLLALLRVLLVVGPLLPHASASEPDPKPEAGALQPMRMEILVDSGVHSSGRAMNAELWVRNSDVAVREVKQVDFVLEPGHFVCDEIDGASDGVRVAPLGTEDGAAGRHIEQAVIASWEPATALVVDPGTSQRRFLSIPSRLSGCVFDGANVLALLGMSSGTFNVRAEAVLADGGRITGQTNVRFDVPFRVVLVGALVGNLLVTLLLALLGLARSIEGRRSALKAIAREFLVQAGVRLPIGFTAATIALVLARASLDVPGLVSVEVNDFLGGVIVGLFAQAASRPIAEWLTGVPLPDAGASRAEPKPAATG